MMSFTLAYFLRLGAWGLAAALLLGGPVWMSWRCWDRLLARANTEARHRLACSHFLALLILPTATVVGVCLALAATGTEIIRQPPHPRIFLGGTGQGGEWLAMAAWLAGVLLALGRLAADARQFRRLKGALAPVSLVEEVRCLVSRFPGSMALSVRTAEVLVPQVAGVVRPTLRVPVGFIGLPAVEREAVLMHELAHVARCDFAANLAQRLALAALWFQPVGWMLYRQIAREREALCDEMAVRHGASAPALARALVRLAEDHLSPPIAMAIGSRGDTLRRVNLLLTAEKGVLVRRHWRGAFVGTLALVLAGLSGTWLAASDGRMLDLYIASALGPVVSVHASDPGGTFGLRIRHGHVLEATVQDRPLPPANIQQRGEQVILMGAAKEAVVALRVNPFGRIEWQARPAKATRD